MINNQDQINRLHDKLETLLKKQEDFSKEVSDLREELAQLKRTGTKRPLEKEEPVQKGSSKTQPGYSYNLASKKLYRNANNKVIGGVCAALAEYFKINKILLRILWIIFFLFFGVGFIFYLVLWVAIPVDPNFHTPAVKKQFAGSGLQEHRTQVASKPPAKGMDLEKFIGENLINKIGIAVVIIGVAIGAKYTIDHDLISPLTRIILGYIVGLGLLGFGLKLKQKYKNFSAVLISGAMAIFYFITYFAYSFYDLLPQSATFVLMTFFTIATVLAALNYNYQIIAHIGLVGAYAVPFLLNDDPADIIVLFSYMAIINIGILVIAFKKYWKPLYFSSFFLTWLIYFNWYAPNFEITEHFGMALIFLFLFFVIFYAIFLGFKLLQKEKFEISDIILLLVNSFIFYGIGYHILDNHATGTDLLGTFTVFNGLLHLIVSIIIYRQKLSDKNLFYLVSGLVLVFITIAIPVQLNGNWVTLLWIGEAALLFWIGKTKQNPVYENLSYPLMILAVISIFQDWSSTYYLNVYRTIETRITPIFNIHFLTSLLFIAAFGFINKLNFNKEYSSSLKAQRDLEKWVSFLIPTILLSSIYLAFRIEIANYWNQLFADSKIPLSGYANQFNYDLKSFKVIWILNYSLLFFSVLSFMNIRKFKNRQLGLINLGLSTFTILIFLTQGLYAFSELRERYLEQTFAAYYESSQLTIGIRYISFVFVVVTLLACYKYIRQEFLKTDFKIAFDLLLHISILWIISSELLNIMDLSGANESHKLGLSILWGFYSLILIALGIWKQKKHLRIGAIVLFGFTLIKLFFYDIAHINNISKTIVFLSLGILLLIISFLYNKFKHVISEEIKN